MFGQHRSNASYSVIFILQASSQDVKDVWTAEIKRVLLSQFDVLRGMLSCFIINFKDYFV